MNLNPKQSFAILEREFGRRRCCFAANESGERDQNTTQQHAHEVRRAITMPQGGEHPNGQETKGFREFSSDNEPSRLFLSEHVVEELPSNNTTIVQTIRALGPFAEFLKRKTADPQEFLLKALAKHRVVILG